jgi:hypothetical protein
MSEDKDGCELDFHEMPTSDVDIEKWLEPEAEDDDGA